MSRFTHFDAEGRPRMVDVGGKPVTARQAIAAGRVRVSAETAERIRDRRVEKGDVLAVARLAGILGAKRTADLIPLCHSLAVDAIEVDLRLDEAAGTVEIEARVRCQGRTGVEMEALAAVSIAALTVYDMCKAADRGMSITDVRLVEKSGGRSGTWRRED